MKKKKNKKDDGEDDIVDENHNEEDSLIPVSFYPTMDRGYKYIDDQVGTRTHMLVILL